MRMFMDDYLRKLSSESILELINIIPEEREGGLIIFQVINLDIRNNDFLLFMRIRRIDASCHKKRNIKKRVTSNIHDDR